MASMSKRSRFTEPSKGEIKRQENLKAWITFFRRNIHRFIEEYMGIKLHPYQVLMLRMLQTSTAFYAVAARATAKSFIIAVFSVAKAILYPGVKIVIVAKTLSQAGIIINDKVKLMMTYSPFIGAEIAKIRESKTGYSAFFNNGSVIEAVQSSDSARGHRAQQIIVEESRLVDHDVLEKVIKPFLSLRNPPFKSLPEYKGNKIYREMPLISQITSAHYADADWYREAMSIIERVAKGDKGANFIAFDHLTAVRYGIKTKDVLRGEMATSDRTTVQHEYHNIPSTISDRAYYDFSYFKRSVNKAFYPQRLSTFNPRKNPYGIAKVDGEIRILSADIAVMSGSARDLTILGCIRLIPGKRGYSKSVVYMESHSGVNTAIQARRIKQVFFDFEADHLVLDTRNIGLSVFEELGKATTDEERNVAYPGFTLSHYNLLSPEQRRDYLARISTPNGLPVVFPILGSATFNAEMFSDFKASLQNGEWSFLVHELDAENYLIENQPEYIGSGANSDSVAFFKNPYAQTSLFIDECVNLEATLLNNVVKLERRNGRKDRFTTVCYANYLASILDRELTNVNTYDNEVQEMMDLTLVF